MNHRTFSLLAALALVTVAIGQSLCAWRDAEVAAPLHTHAGGKRSVAEAATATAAEAKRTKAPDDLPVVAMPAALADAVEALLFGVDDGLLGYLRCVDLVAQGEATRELASQAVVARLLADAAAAAPQLRQAGLPAVFLLADSSPTLAVAEMGRRYLAGLSDHPVHAQLRTRLGTWPDPIDRAAVAKLVEALLELGERELEAELAKLLAAGDRLSRCAIREVLGTLAGGSDSAKVAVVVWALLHGPDGPTTGAVQLLGCATELQAALASEHTAPAVNHLALAVRSMLAGDQYMRFHADPRLRATLADALGAAAHGAVDQQGSAIFAAVAMGGVGEDSRAAKALATLSTVSPNYAIRNTAIVNLGYVTDPVGFVAMSPRFHDAPTEDAVLLPHLDYLVGLTMAMRRHPEQVDVVVPFFESALATWRATPLQGQARGNLLSLIAEDPRPEFAPFLRRIAADGRDPQAAVAKQILEQIR